MSKFKVAIVGAGISGLAFASALQKLAPDVDFVVYEGASKLSEIGAGIGVRPRTWAIIKALGLEEALLKVAGDGQQSFISFVQYKSDQPKAMSFDKDKLIEKTYTFRRADLQKVLAENLRSPDFLVLGKRLEAYSQNEDGSGPVELRFQDGMTTTCDVLIGCDGVKSSVRAEMYTRYANTAEAAGTPEEPEELRSHIKPRFSGEVVYRTLIRKETLPEEVATIPIFNTSAVVLYCGKYKHLVIYPVANGRILNVGVGVTCPDQEGTVYDGPWMASATKEEIAEHISGWERNAQEIVKYIDGGIRWAINVTTKLPTFVQGRVALLGDSAHAMGHHLGSGAGQCFEDAFLLAEYFGNPRITRENIEIALQVYDEIRRPFSQNIQALSRRSAQLHHFAIPELKDMTVEDSASGSAISQEQLWEYGKMLEEMRHWCEKSDIMVEHEGSLRRLEEELKRISV